MTKNEIEFARNILSMVTGDCPYERGIGEEINKCKSEKCIDCWKIALTQELKK